MKIQITIPESAMEDVELFCELEQIELQHRIQQAINEFLEKVICYMAEIKKAKIEVSNGN